MYATLWEIDSNSIKQVSCSVYVKKSFKCLKFLCLKTPRNSVFPENTMKMYFDRPPSIFPLYCDVYDFLIHFGKLSSIPGTIGTLDLPEETYYSLF